MPGSHVLTYSTCQITLLVEVLPWPVPPSSCYLHTTDVNTLMTPFLHARILKKGKGSPYLITKRRVPELLPVLVAVSLRVTWVINPAVDCHYFPPVLQLPSHALRGLLLFRCLVNRGTMGMNSLPKTVTRQHRSCDLNTGPSAPESSTLTTRLPSHRKNITSRLTDDPGQPVGL